MLWKDPRRVREEKLVLRAVHGENKKDKAEKKRMEKKWNRMERHRKESGKGKDAQKSGTRADAHRIVGRSVNSQKAIEAGQLRPLVETHQS
jgi:hypothetical protein